MDKKTAASIFRKLPFSIFRIKPGSKDHSQPNKRQAVSTAPAVFFFLDKASLGKTRLRTIR